MLKIVNINFLGLSISKIYQPYSIYFQIPNNEDKGKYIKMNNNKGITWAKDIIALKDYHFNQKLNGCTQKVNNSTIIKNV